MAEVQTSQGGFEPVQKRFSFIEMWKTNTLKSQLCPIRKIIVYKIQVNPIHPILKYGYYYDYG